MELRYWLSALYLIDRSGSGGQQSNPSHQKTELMSNELPDPTKRRRYPRYSIDVRVSAKVFRADAPVELWGRSIELGRDGIGVTLTGQLEPGEVATLELTLPASSALLKLRALVRYRDGLRHGFEFLARDGIQEDLIKRTCELLAFGQEENRK